MTEHVHECQHGHPHDGRCECVCGYEAWSASKPGGPEPWHAPQTPTAEPFVPSKETKLCTNCQQMVPVNCCHWPCYPRPSQGESSSPEPRRACPICNRTVDTDAETFRHGYGNCVPIDPASVCAEKLAAAEKHITILRAQRDEWPQRVAALPWGRWALEIGVGNLDDIKREVMYLCAADLPSEEA